MGLHLRTSDKHLDNNIYHHVHDPHCCFCRVWSLQLSPCWTPGLPSRRLPTCCSPTSCSTCCCCPSGTSSSCGGSSSSQDGDEAFCLHGRREGTRAVNSVLFIHLSIETLHSNSNLQFNCFRRK